jgi:hypothetical protein
LSRRPAGTCSWSSTGPPGTPRSQCWPFQNQRVRQAYLGGCSGTAAAASPGGCSDSLGRIRHRRCPMGCTGATGPGSTAAVVVASRP